jgi:hypothetical protein
MYCSKTIIDNYSINSQEYKTELVNQVEKFGRADLSYWFNSYREENGKEYCKLPRTSAIKSECYCS